MKLTSKTKRIKPRFFNLDLGVLLTVILLGSLGLSTLCVGCASFKRPIIHALPTDFVEMNHEGKHGYWCSDYFISEVMEIDVDSIKAEK